MQDHPLRRRYGLELALGMGVAVLAAWLVLGSEERGVGGRIPGDSATGDSSGPEPEVLAEPAVPPGAGAEVRREPLQEARAAAGEPAPRFAVDRARPTERLRAERTQADQPRVVLRAVDERGEPLRGTELHLTVIQETLAPQRMVLPTDAEGHCELHLVGPHDFDHPRKLEVEVHRSSPLRGEVDLPAELEHEGPTDLGDVVLFGAEAVLLAAGTVTDDRGPVPGAEVHVWPRLTGYRHRRRTTADERGRFELRGLPVEGTLWVMASAPDHAVGTPIEVDPGAIGLALELRLSVPLEIEVLLDDEVRRASIDVTLITGSRSTPLPLNGSIDVPLGIHALEVRVDGGLYSERIEGIQIAPGPEGIDPRIRPLDLRGRLRLAAFDLRDERGVPLAERRVPASLDTGTRGASSTSREGRLTLAVPPQATTVELAPGGFVPRTVPIRDAPQEVVFTPR